MTTPRDDIAGLIERLRERAATRNTLTRVPDTDFATMGYYSAGSATLDREAATQLDSLLKERDALQALSARVKELTGLLANGEDLRCKVKDVAEQWQARALRAEQERDEAYERAAKVAETYRRKVVGRNMKEATFDPAGRWEGGAIYDTPTVKSGIAAAIRRLASGPEKEGKE